MRLNRILTIFRKDMRDAVRDARVLMAIIVPFGLGIFYNVIMDEDESMPDVTIAWTGDSASRLPDRLVTVAQQAVEPRLKHASDESAVRSQVADEDADIGLVIPDGFDNSVTAGEQPRLTVLLAESPSFGAEYVAAALAPVLREMAGQFAPAELDIQPVVTDDAGDVTTRVGLRTYFVLGSVLFLIGMIAMLAVPVILADEAEKHTLDALVMVASYAEVVIAKALFGFSYIVVGVTLLLAVTGIMPDNLPLFVAGMAAFSVALVGFGLLMGGLFNATQLNTWGGLLLLPVLFPAFVTGLPVPRAVEIAALLLPTSHASRIALNSVSGEAIFSNLWLSFLAIAAWAFAGYGLLLWHLSRREA